MNAIRIKFQTMKKEQWSMIDPVAANPAAIAPKIGQL